ncbi:MAG: STAS domain-containing protein, partial [Mogibacterium sp.]|nr:STAS domain-containing protein [Mogibacterium sp.]
MLNIKKDIDNGKLTFALEGRLDTVTSPELESAIKESIDGATELVMDFKDLEYISSAGLRVLLS